MREGFNRWCNGQRDSWRPLVLHSWRQGLSRVTYLSESLDYRLHSSRLVDWLISGGVNAHVLSSSVRLASIVVLIGAWAQRVKFVRLVRSLSRSFCRQLPLSVRRALGIDLYALHGELAHAEHQLEDNQKFLKETREVFTEQCSTVLESHAVVETEQTQIRRHLAGLADELNMLSHESGQAVDPELACLQAAERQTLSHQGVSIDGIVTKSPPRAYSELATSKGAMQPLVADTNAEQTPTSGDKGPAVKSPSRDFQSKKSRNNSESQSLEQLAMEYAELARELKHKRASLGASSLQRNRRPAIDKA